MRFKKNITGDNNFSEENEDFYPNTEDQSEFYYQQLDLSIKNLNRRILYLTIKMLENSFFWKFRTHKNKLKIISETYQVLNEIISYEEIE